MPLPPLPSLPNSWQSCIFGDQTRVASITTSVPGFEVEASLNTQRLAFIGDAVLHLGITDWLHGRYPTHGNSSLMAKRIALLEERPAEWAKLYKLPSRLVVRSATGEANNPVSKGDLFRAYVAAVYLHGGGSGAGSNITNGWMKELLNFEQEEGIAEVDSDESSNGGMNSTAFDRTSDGDELSGMLNDLLTLPNQTPKQKLATQPPPNALNVQTSNSRNALSLLNEMATRRRAQLAWDDNSSGPDHAKTWASKLLVEDQEFIGSGHNKKQARSSAAEIALKSLKWD
ncbi:hypothetical protein K439DRAFT_691549 [Ramaria rubella]|nr:hypothetical protein K439DRAFT_691549 [Ramaria rubella]